jgi:ABC-2 type transport system ATP-binding protein
MNAALPLSCSGIHKRYGDQSVLEDVSLALPPGSVVGLIGRNGSGKTTLIRILMGLAQPNAGKAWICGEPALLAGDAVKARLGYVPQLPDAFGWMRVSDMFDLLATFYPDWDRQFVQQSMQRWNVDTKKRLGRLSPGERQRVALTRALAPRPQLLVLDEPASALDPVARRELLRELAVRAADSGTTVLFSTHIVSDLERVASHVAFLHEGRLLLDTAMDELKETHARLTVPSVSAERVAQALPGELRRRKRSDGSLSLVIARQAGHDWPAAAQLPGARLDTLGLEDLFVEIVE